MSVLLFCVQPVFDLLLWSIEQVQDYQAPTYEFAVSVLQTISQVSCCSWQQLLPVW